MPALRCGALPRVGSYGRYSNKNYGLNCLYMTVGDLTLYFSYDTCIAFEIRGVGQTVLRNYWGLTTGRHLNWINSNKAIRVDQDEFDRRWGIQVEPILLAKGCAATSQAQATEPPDQGPRVLDRRPRKRK